MYIISTNSNLEQVTQVVLCIIIISRMNNILKHKLEQSIMKVVSSHATTLLDSFEVHFSSHQTKALKLKLMVLKLFGEQPLGLLGQSKLFREKHAAF